MKLNKYTAIVLIVIASFVISDLSVAATQALKTRLSRGYTHLMCDADTSTGVCDGNSTEDIYAIVDEYESITFFFYETGSGSTCDVYATGYREGTPALGVDLTNYQANKINSTALSASLDKITFTDIDFKYAWVNCTAIGGGSDATVEMIGSVGMKRD